MSYIEIRSKSRSFVSLLTFLSFIPFLIIPLSSASSEPAVNATYSTRLILLGTAGGPPIRINRVEPGALLVVEGMPYIIDFGVGAMRSLASAGFQADDIGTIFITHNHLDHNGGLVNLISYSSFLNRKDPVVVVGPAGTDLLVRASIDYLSVSRRVFESARPGSPDPKTIYRATTISGDGLVFQDSRVKVTAVENSHYNLKPGSPGYELDRSYSYRFETPGRVIVFTGDTGPSDAVTNLARGADVLVSEVVDVPSVLRWTAATLPYAKGNEAYIESHMRHEHLTPEEVGKMAAKAGVKMVVLTHFAPGLDEEVDMTKYTDGVRRHYKGIVVAGKDLMEF